MCSRITLDSLGPRRLPRCERDWLDNNTECYSRTRRTGFIQDLLVVGFLGKPYCSPDASRRLHSGMSRRPSLGSGTFILHSELDPASPWRDYAGDVWLKSAAMRSPVGELNLKNTGEDGVASDVLWMLIPVQNGQWIGLKFARLLGMFYAEILGCSSWRKETVQPLYCA